MQLRRALGLALVVTAGAFTACKEPPFFPRWDSDMYMPLSTQPVKLGTLFGIATIPPGVAAPDTVTTTQTLSGVLKDILKNVVTDPARCTSTVNPALSCDQLKLTITKTAAIALTDTLFVANAKAGLNAATAGTVVFPISLATSVATKTDSIFLTQPSVAMLQAAGQNGTTLWIMLRGQANSGNGVTITSSDSIAVTTSVTVRISTVHN